MAKFGETPIEDVDALSNDPGLPSYTDLAQVISDLLDWADHTGGWDAPVWERAQRCVSAIYRAQATASMPATQ